MIIKIHKILYSTTAEGFGRRCCIWVQGCSHHCKGCMAQHTWNVEDGVAMDTEEIVANIRNQKEMEGITLLGGEPFEQAMELDAILSRVQDMNLSIIAFTGYQYEQLLHSNMEGVQELLGKVDLLVDGPYIQELRSFKRPWVGSDNQRFLFLTDRYSQEELKKTKNRLEVRISKDGSITINGMTDFIKKGEVE